MTKSEATGINNEMYEDSWNLLERLIDARDAEKMICSMKNNESLLQEANEYYRLFDSVNLRRLKNHYIVARLKRTLFKTIPQLLKTTVKLSRVVYLICFT